MPMFWVEYVGDRQVFDGGIEISMEISAQHVEAATENEAIQKVVDLVKNFVRVVPLDFSADEESDEDDDDDEEDDIDLDEDFDEDDDEEDYSDSNHGLLF